MQTLSCTRTTLLAAVGAALAGCVYPPAAQTYVFERHPGVVLEVGWQYAYDGYDGSSHMVSTLVNRSSVDKCAWTDAMPSRLLRSGEAWQVGMVHSPGGVGVANVMPWDPQCAQAKAQVR